MAIQGRRAGGRREALFYERKLMKINHNLSAVISNTELRKNEFSVEKSIEKLSSGIAINHSKDNPVGMAISNMMKTQIKGLNRASENAQNTSSLLNTAEGALSEIHSLVQRMRELAVQAGNDTNTETDRESLAQEMEAMRKEIDRISRDTEFNGVGLLDGTLDERMTPSKSTNSAAGIPQPDLDRIYASDAVEAGTYKMKVDWVNGEAKLSDFTYNGQQLYDVTFKSEGNHAYIQRPDGFQMDFLINRDLGAGINITLEISNMGRLQAQVGADENQIELLRIPKINSEMLYLDDISFKSSEDTDKALDKMDKAIDKISSFRSHIGAMTNRIDYTVSYLDENAENMESSVSTIADTDMAEEMTEYTTQNVLVQSATAMLAQANDAPEQLLSLLQ